MAKHCFHHYAFNDWSCCWCGARTQMAKRPLLDQNHGPFQHEGASATIAYEMVPTNESDCEREELSTNGKAATLPMPRPVGMD